ncbi:hypothetical protein [Williamsia sp. CHRR-6]|uniref:hypothetical protein n=1 Tax=Williamsia sp. CHRR-6 TaxID=2835871 RepID=UPI001BD98316|nr:hypothetical protein [Williamsia sp. CHRR-6]MBT0568046.1 hypothetical protein [Williamsia sp. CHRR-6]
MAESNDTDAPTTAATVSSAVVGSVRGFVSRTGGSATAVISPVGRAGVRVMLVGADGTMGDRVVADVATAHALIDAVDGLTAAQWDRELSSIATPAPGHYAKMAGWVART